VPEIVAAFERNDKAIGAAADTKRFGSDNVLCLLAEDLLSLGFDVETSKKKTGKIDRPVFFGEGGVPSLRYQVDAFHAEWL
jgi:hypothetical protein